MKKSVLFFVLGLTFVPLVGFAQPNSDVEGGGSATVTTPAPATVVSPAPATITNPAPATITNLVPAGGPPAGSGQQQVPTGGGQPVPPNNQNQPTPNIAKLENPLGSKANSLTGLFIKLVNIVVNISYAVVAFFLILSGFKFVVAQGKPKEIEDAKKTFWYTIVGGLIIVGAQTIARILEELVKNL